MSFALVPLCLALAAAPVTPAEKVKPLPSLTRAPKIDGDWKDLAPAFDVKMPKAATGASSSLKVKAAVLKDTLYVGVQATDDQVTPGDAVAITLFFPESGVTSRGVTTAFDHQGHATAPGEAGAPAWAQALVQSAAKDDKKGFTLEVAFPGRALPRFQASRPMLLSLCVEYTDVDGEGEPQKLTTCPSLEMEGGPTRLPDDFRKNLKLAPPADAEGIEAREKGWVAFSQLHYPVWALGDADFTPESLKALISPDDAVEPASVSLPAPPELVLPDGRPIFTVLKGKNPFGAGSCDTSRELRLALYAVKGAVASRVLEWPVATCQLGRAMRYELSPEGLLSIGYDHGTTSHFAWSTDHFERAELGRRD